jgi:sugar (pentulose or hexulose) kinase
MKKSLLVGAGVLAIALMGAGCGATTNTTGSTGAVTVPGVVAPTATAPSDIPVYPGSTVTLSGGTAATYLVAMTTNDTAAQVLAWYQTAFTSAGFKAGGGINLAASSVLYGKGNVGMYLGVIDKSQPAAKGVTIIKITRQVQPN